MVVDEQEKELIITIQRRGFLGETSFVTVEGKSCEIAKNPKIFLRFFEIVIFVKNVIFVKIVIF